MRQWLAGVVVGAIVGGLVAGILIAVLVPSSSRAAPEEQAVPRVVRAEQFQLVDARGCIRAGIGLDDEGATLLALYDQDGAGLLELTVRRGVSRARLFSGDGETGLELHSHRIAEPRGGGLSRIAVSGGDAYAELAVLRFQSGGPSAQVAAMGPRGATSIFISDSADPFGPPVWRAP
jgi:hypothetical protein